MLHRSTRSQAGYSFTELLEPRVPVISYSFAIRDDGFGERWQVIFLSLKVTEKEQKNTQGYAMRFFNAYWSSACAVDGGEEVKEEGGVLHGFH